jgi:hypothetical protein
LGAETFLHIEPAAGTAAAATAAAPATAPTIASASATATPSSPLLVIRLLGGLAPEPGTAVEAAFDPATAHYFALGTGARLG